jgi:rhomboid protease GluP
MQKNSPVVLGIIAVCVLVWLAQSFTEQSGLSITERFASFPPFIAAGEWWRLITPMFLHLPLGGNGGARSLMHIGFNMYILYLYGPYVEEAVGSVRFLALYLIMGFGGGAASYAFGSCGATSLGASGAVFGVVGFLVVYMYRRRSSIVSARFMQSLLFLVGINLLIGFTLPGIDNMAHLGGLLSGAALGGAVDSGTIVQRPLAVQVLGMVAVAGAALALVIWRTGSFTCP